MRQIVGVGIVVYMSLIFVGTYYIVYFVAVKFLVVFDSCCPVFCTVQNKLIAAAIHKVLVAAYLIVVICAESHIGGDVQLQISGVTPGGSSLSVGDPCRLPGVSRTLAAGLLCILAGGADTVVSVFAKASRLVGSGENKEGKHIVFRVPESVTVIAGTGKTFCADVHSVVVNGRHNGKMIYGKVQSKLVGVGAVDRNIAPAPDSFLPLGSAFVGNLVKGLLLGGKQGTAGGVRKAEQAAAVALTVAVCIYHAALFQYNIAVSGKLEGNFGSCLFAACFRFYIAVRVYCNGGSGGKGNAGLLSFRGHHHNAVLKGSVHSPEMSLFLNALAVNTGDNFDICRFIRQRMNGYCRRRKMLVFKGHYALK